METVIKAEGERIWFDVYRIRLVYIDWEDRTNLELIQEKFGELEFICSKVAYNNWVCMWDRLSHKGAPAITSGE